VSLLYPYSPPNSEETISSVQLSQVHDIYPVVPDYEEFPHKPTRRSECAEVPRPCPYVSCAFNNYLDVKDGKIVRQLPMAPEDVPPEASCALDLIGSYPEDVGVSYTIEELAVILGISVTEMRKLEEEIIRKLRHFKTARELERLWTAYQEP
jgi:hypothetical protein